MTVTQRRRLEEMLVAAMTSGIAQKGGEYRMPETLAIEYGRLCYNMAVKDMLDMFIAFDFGEIGLEMSERLSDLHLTQKITL